MVSPVFLPVRIWRSRSCERCGLRFSVSDEQCPHCTQLSDREVENLKERMAEQQVAHKQLGRILLVVAAAMALVLLVRFL